MADPGDLYTDDDTGLTRVVSSPGMPRWVKAFLIIGLALVLLFLLGKVTGLGGEHGPGRHGGGDDTPSSVVDEDSGHQPPIDHGP